MIKSNISRRGLRRLLALTIALQAFLWSAVTARAGQDVFHIFNSAIEEGHWNAELVTGFQSGFPSHRDDDHHGNVRAASELGLTTYPTHFWMTKVALEFERESGGNFEPVAITSKNVISFDAFTPHNVNAGWFTALTGALSDEGTNAVEFGPVMTLSSGPASLTLNPFLEKTFGHNEEPGIAFVYAYRATYSLSERFSIGMEGYGEIENIGSGPPGSGQVHRIGPVLYFGTVHGLGHEPDHDKHSTAHGGWHAEVGLLFGLTASTPDEAIKFNTGLDF